MDGAMNRVEWAPVWSVVFGGAGDVMTHWVEAAADEGAGAYRWLRTHVPDGAKRVEFRTMDGALVPLPARIGAPKGTRMPALMFGDLR